MFIKARHGKRSVEDDLPPVKRRPKKSSFHVIESPGLRVAMRDRALSCFNSENSKQVRTRPEISHLQLEQFQEAFPALRIVFLGVNDEFAGRMQRYVYEKHPGWVVGSVVSMRPVYKKTKIGAFIFLLKCSGFRYLAEMVRIKIARKLLRGREIPTPKRLARANQVEIYYSRNINAAQSLAKLAEWSPDVIISTNFSDYIAGPARRCARLGTWNLHKSLLPHYRGMAPSFYALLNREKKVGATLHQVAKGFDTGDILCQIELPIGEGDSVESLNRRTSDVGGQMLAQYLESVDLSEIHAIPQPQGNWPTYSYPTRLDVSVFRKMGCSF